jgi:hypothetical protein
MPRNLFVGLTLATLASSSAAQEPKSTATISWRTDLDAARAEAARDHKPLVVVFRCER